MKKVFIGATRQNDGKTMVSMGLFHAFQKRFKSIAYMKPVGQDYKVVDGAKIDKDVVLFKKTYGLPEHMPLMSPVAVPKGFTEKYIDEPTHDEIVARIQNGYDALSHERDFLLIEGTGHAGVGSVFDMSNADVAKQLDAKVVLVSLGGIGRCIDEIMMNKALFEQKGVEIAGVIINKVREDKYDKVADYVRRGLSRLGLDVFGVIPWVNMLTKPCVAELVEVLNATVLSGEEKLLNSVKKCIIGDMQARDALDVYDEDTCLIVPANREDLVLTALVGYNVEGHTKYYLSGIIFTGGIEPHPRIMGMIKHTKIPLLLVKEDSFNVATKINRMLVKLRSEESEKISKIQDLIDDFVDVDAIIEKIS